MASVNITISKDAYDFLKSIKGSKSFSQTILQFKQQKDYMRFAGGLKNTVLKEDFQNYSASVRKSFQERFS